MRYALIACLVASSLAADAPDLAPKTGHDLYHQYYQYWYNKRGSHCCHEQHCRPGEFRWTPETGWQVKLRDGSWYAWSASDEVVDDRDLGPFGSICDQHTIYPGGDEYMHVYCVDPPDASG